jgi:hypothetical protein
VDQDVDVGKRLLEMAGRGRFHPRADDARWTVEGRWRWNRVDGGQRQSRTIIVVHSRGIVSVTFQDPVGLQMAMDDGVNVALFLGFMNVLGRRDGKQSHHRAQHAGEKLGRVHEAMVSDCRTRHQSRGFTDDGS